MTAASAHGRLSPAETGDVAVGTPVIPRLPTALTAAPYQRSQEISPPPPDPPGWHLGVTGGVALAGAWGERLTGGGSSRPCDPTPRGGAGAPSLPAAAALPARPDGGQGFAIRH